MGPGQDASTLTAALAEFQALRAEIVQRIQAQQGLYALCVLGNGALLGAGLAGTKAHPAVFLCIPFVSSAIGLAYADHTRRIFYIGEYIRDRLWPSITGLVERPLQSWEEVFAETMTLRTPFQAMLTTAYLATLFVFIPLAASAYAASASHWDQSSGEWILWCAGILTTLFYVVVAGAVGLRYGMSWPAVDAPGD
jgi:hypothetical protein